MRGAVIIGGGVLGVSIAYWLSSVYEGGVCLIEKDSMACHSTQRNTGVVHRPFYLDPKEKGVFARASRLSHPLWKRLAMDSKVPWEETGTLKLALDENGVKTLEKNILWGIANGMEDNELSLLSKEEAGSMEPNVRCEAALSCKTDVSTDFKILTEALRTKTSSMGCEFVTGKEVTDVEEKDRITITLKDGEKIESSFAINAAGGWSIDILHKMGLAENYEDLHFLGEYWEVNEKLASRNIYTVPRYPEFPFLDPHWVCRCDGRFEIGPNAMPVGAPDAYNKSGVAGMLSKLLEKPVTNKLRLLSNARFMDLAAKEWRNASKNGMVSRVAEFIPQIKHSPMGKRGFAGIRSSVMDSMGIFVPEAMEFETSRTFHITNYNSPGATGAPAYAALLVEKMREHGLFKAGKEKRGIWNIDEITKS